MDEYQNSDDEFELMYANFNDECYLIREIHNDLEDSLSLNSDPLLKDDYPNSDEEFEVRYGSELEVLQETEGNQSRNDCLLDDLFTKVSLANQLTQPHNEVNENLDHNSNVSQGKAHLNIKELNSRDHQDSHVEDAIPNRFEMQQTNHTGSCTVKRPLEDMDGYPNAKRTFN